MGEIGARLFADPAELAADEPAAAAVGHCRMHRAVHARKIKIRRPGTGGVQPDPGAGRGSDVVEGAAQIEDRIAPRRPVQRIEFPARIQAVATQRQRLHAAGGRIAGARIPGRIDDAAGDGEIEPGDAVASEAADGVEVAARVQDGSAQRQRAHRGIGAQIAVVAAPVPPLTAAMRLRAAPPIWVKSPPA